MLGVLSCDREMGSGMASIVPRDQVNRLTDEKHDTGA